MFEAYGLDIGGFSTGTSRVAHTQFAISDESLRATLIESVWSRKVDGPTLISPLRTEIHAEVKTWGTRAVMVVDVPIDVQGLPHPFGYVPCLHWELTQRPIDYALSALPPFAQRLGAAVARWRALSSQPSKTLGEFLFESYPKGSLLLSGLPTKGYKKAVARFNDGEWTATTRKHRQHAESDWSPQHPLALILQGLRAQAPVEFICDDDFIDALLCSVAGVPGQHIIEGHELQERAEVEATRQGRILPAKWRLPAGYRLVDLRRAAWKNVQFDQLSSSCLTNIHDQ